MVQVNYKYNMAEEGIKHGNELVLDLLKMKQETGKPMSKHRIAKVVGVSTQAVDKWVDGESSPLRHNFENIVKYYKFIETLNKIRPFGR